MNMVLPGWFIPSCVFASVALASWSLLSVFAGRNGSLESRLRDLKRSGRHPDSPRALMRDQARAQRMLEKTTEQLSRIMMPKGEAEASDLRARLLHAGYRGASAAGVYMGLKALLLLLFGGVTMAVLYTRTGMAGNGWLTTVLAAGAGFYLPDVWVWWRTHKRQEAIFCGMPDALDLLVVCVEAGLGLDAALRRVAIEMKRSNPILAEEFQIANFQLQMGTARKTVLRNLGTRCGVEDVRALTAILIQADRFGASIAHALRTQSDAMRVRRRQLAEERAAKTAVKLTFPLVLFIFPGIFVVLVGSAAIQIMRNLLPTMSGG